jgi:drug/metabolite transporter (DMT)-like permease
MDVRRTTPKQWIGATILLAAVILVVGAIGFVAVDALSACACTTIPNGSVLGVVAQG